MLLRLIFPWEAKLKKKKKVVEFSSIKQLITKVDIERGI